MTPEPTTPPSPKRTEVTEEVKERLELLDLDRTPRPEKLAREAALLEGASEVRLRERGFRMRHPAGLEQVRGAVDAMEERRAARPLPEVPAAPPPPPPLPKPVPDELRRALAPLVEGDVVSVDVLYRTDEGEAVEATIERGGARRTEAFLVEGGRARPMADVESRIDALEPPPPEAAPAAPPPAPPSPADAGPAKRRLRLPFGKKKP